MPRTLDQAFTEFHQRLQPGAGETRLARRHRVSLRRALVRAFDLKQLSACGSWENNTSLAGWSDADYLAWLPAERVAPDSRLLLREVGASLRGSFPRTSIATNTPAVRVAFGQRACETAEIVPGKRCGQTGAGFPIYSIADGRGGWMKTSPHAHNAWIRAHDVTFHKRLKPLICLLKAWKYGNGVPISSFYLEMSAARHMKGKAKVVFERDVAGFFAQLHAHPSAVRDPTGVAGLIAPCQTPAKHAAALSKIKTASARAGKALDAASGGDWPEALRLYRLLFGPKFPVFGG